MKFDEKLTITLNPGIHGVFGARAYGEEYLASMIHEAIGLLDRHGQPLKIEVVLDEHVVESVGGVIFEYTANLDHGSMFGATRAIELKLNLDQLYAEEAVRLLMTHRAAAIGQLLLVAIQHPIIYGSSDLMIDLIAEFPKLI